MITTNQLRRADVCNTYGTVFLKPNVPGSTRNRRRNPRTVPVPLLCSLKVTLAGGRLQIHPCSLAWRHGGFISPVRSVSRAPLAWHVTKAEAVGTEPDGGGDWSYWDDDDYNLVDYVIASAIEEQDDSFKDGGEPTGVKLTGMVATASRRTAEAVGSTASGTAGLLWDAGAKVGTAAGRTPVGRAAARAHSSWEEAAAELPKGLWNRALWFWNRPTFQRLRFTISMANLSVRLPAILALVGTQIGLLATQVSLPMLAPLLLGTGMMIRSIKANASIIFPRIGLMVVLLWMLWFMNTLIHNTVMYLRRQGAIDQRVAGLVINGSELCVLLAAVVIFLSMLGLNLSSLLIPIGIAAAIAAKDLSHNFLAGFFLFAVQPFKLGDRVGVPYTNPGARPSDAQAGWFEGVCEKVDLRYTTIQRGRRRLLVPNSSFLTREFMVIDDPAPTSEPWRPPAHAAAASRAQVPPCPSDWVRHAVLEEQPFHSAQEESSSSSFKLSGSSNSNSRTRRPNGGRSLQRSAPSANDQHKIQKQRRQKVEQQRQQEQQQGQQQQQEQNLPRDLEPFSVLD